jgi:NAD(P)-dependent dehydrogenase (short-subunit alcohol dehydrogenase family)
LLNKSASAALWDYSQPTGISQLMTQEKPHIDLTGRVALITGASRGIGLAVAQAYAQAGARVVLVSRKQESLDEVAEIIRKEGGDALPLAAHTGDVAAIQQVVGRAIETYGGIDILVNNAGTNPHFGPILTAEESQWEKILDVNLRGYFRLAKACVPCMRERGGGKIINVASIAGMRPQPGMGVYCVSKAGVIMLTQVLAQELASENIQVNAIAPGFIKTRFSRALWENPAIYEKIVSSTPQGRMAGPEEITGIALYLAAEVSSFTTGAVFVVDGGLMVSSGISLA